MTHTSHMQGQPIIDLPVHGQERLCGISLMGRDCGRCTSCRHFAPVLFQGFCVECAAFHNIDLMRPQHPERPRWSR